MFLSVQENEQPLAVIRNALKQYFLLQIQLLLLFIIKTYNKSNNCKKYILDVDYYSFFGFVFLLVLPSVNGDSGYTKEQTHESKLPNSYREDLVLSMCT